MAFDVTELRALSKTFQVKGSDVEARAEVMVEKTAVDVEARSKVLARVDTGFLMGSISREVRGTSAVIGPTAHYGIYLETGTSRMRPYPFMGPSLDAVSPGFVKAAEMLGMDIV